MRRTLLAPWPICTAGAYDYRASGHAHRFEIVAYAPPVVFSGCTQGRHIRETGPKGCVLVTVAEPVVARHDGLPAMARRKEVDAALAELASIPDPPDDFGAKRREAERDLGVAADGIGPEIEDLETEIQRLEQERSAMDRTIGTETSELRRMDGSAAAADCAEEAEARALLPFSAPRRQVPRSRRHRCAGGPGPRTGRKET